MPPEPRDQTVKHIEVFSGSATPAEARVYVEVTLAESQQQSANQFQLSGHLVGPQCEFARTLPVRMPFLDRSDASTLLAEVIMPDPCCWTPELPFLYRAELELKRDESIISRDRITIGIRRFGARGQQLYLEGKRFVLRGVSGQFDNHLFTDSEMAYARETYTTAVVRWPDEILCELASRCGMLMVADLRCNKSRSDNPVVADAIKSIARWPAVIMAIVDPELVPKIQMRGAVRSLLISQYLTDQDTANVNPDAQILFAQVNNLSNFGKGLNIDRPIIAVRRLPQPVKIEIARAACDALQCDLALRGDFAGYVV